MKTWRGTVRMAVGLAVLVLALAGCHSGGQGTQPKETVPPSPIPATSSATAEAAVAAYRGMWAAFVEASKTSDPDAPDIRKYATDNALKLIVGGLVSNRAQGKVAKGDVVLSPAAVATSSSEVSVTDCVDATHWLEYKTSGELWDNKPGGKHRTTATVKTVDGTWKVSSFNLEGTGTC